MERMRSDSSSDPRGLDDTASKLDGVLADPAHHRVLFEDAEVRVVETRISAGEETPVQVYDLLVVARGWAPELYQQWLAAALKRDLLEGQTARTKGSRPRPAPS